MLIFKAVLCESCIIAYTRTRSVPISKRHKDNKLLRSKTHVFIVVVVQMYAKKYTRTKLYNNRKKINIEINGWKTKPNTCKYTVLHTLLCLLSTFFVHIYTYIFVLFLSSIHDEYLFSVSYKYEFTEIQITCIKIVPIIGR